VPGDSPVVQQARRRSARILARTKALATKHAHGRRVDKMLRFCIQHVPGFPQDNGGDSKAAARAIMDNNADVARLYLAHLQGELTDNNRRDVRGTVRNTFSAINGWLQTRGVKRPSDRQGPLDVMQWAREQKRALGRLQHAAHQKQPLSVDTARKILAAWTAEKAKPYQVAVAGFVYLSLQAVARAEAITWIRADQIAFFKDRHGDGLEVASVILTHDKHNQSGRHTHFDIPNSDKTNTFNLLKLLLGRLHGVEVPSLDNDDFYTGNVFDRPTFLFPCFGISAQRARVSRRLYDPPLVFHDRGGAPLRVVNLPGQPLYRRKYLRQFRNALQEVLHLSPQAAGTYGLSSARPGGDTMMFERNIKDSTRRILGRWSQASNEEYKYLRANAFRRARLLLTKQLCI
jgi:hypothetical protein